MAGKWNGFSEEDIKNAKELENKYHDARANSASTRRTTNSNRKNNSAYVNKSKENSLEAQIKTQQQESKQPSNLERIDNQKVEALKNLRNPESNPLNISRNCPVNNESIPTNQTQAAPQESSQDPVSSCNKKSLVTSLVEPTISHPPTAPIDLDDFRNRQRKMEEQNRLRKVFLSRALEDRKKQTHAEQQKLNRIQEELHKLDQRLSCDVSIIRNQIETASVEFMEAQKRYDRAEKEFLEAKLLLFTKLERKELLTHHLCTIIEQNEMRKAQKLSELMEKLNMPDFDIQPEQVEVPSPEPAAEVKRKISAEIILTPATVNGTAVNEAIPTANST